MLGFVACAAVIVPLALLLGRPPRGLASVDAPVGAPVSLVLPRAPSSQLALWVRYELTPNDEDALVRVRWEARSGGVLIGSAASTGENLRVIVDGGPDWLVFTQRIARLAPLVVGAPVEVRMTIEGECSPAGRVLRARVVLAW